MNVGIEVVNEDELTPGERQTAMAMAVLDGVLRLLDEATREEEGERYIALVNAAHDFGSALFHKVSGCCEGPDVSPKTMELLIPLMNQDRVLQ